jgi:hypothetical protein
MPTASSSSDPGLLATLRQQLGSDLVKTGTVKITASGTSLRHQSVLIDGRCAERWYSGNSEDPWLLFEFSHHKVFLTSHQFTCDSTLPNAAAVRPHGAPQMAPA